MAKLKVADIRLWLIPYLKAAVWIASFFISLRYDFGDIRDAHTIRGLILFCSLGLIFDVALDWWNTILAMENYHLKRDDWCIIQFRTVPYLILAYSFSIKTFWGEWTDVTNFDLNINKVWIYVVGYGISWALLKIGISHMDVYVEIHKIQNKEYAMPKSVANP